MGQKYRGVRFFRPTVIRYTTSPQICLSYILLCLCVCMLPSLANKRIHNHTNRISLHVVSKKTPVYF